MTRTSVGRFLIVGAVSTAGYLALYALLRQQVPTQAANALALLVTGDVNTVLNRRWTFGIRGPVPWEERGKGAVSYLISLVTTSVALEILSAMGGSGSVAELATLVLANVVAGVAHYLLLRDWAFSSAQTGARQSDEKTRIVSSGTPADRSSGRSGRLLAS